MKRFFVLLVLFQIIFSVVFAETLYGPYDIDEGIKKFQEITNRKVYHLGDDNALHDYVGQCTWFCYATTNERMPVGNACEWYTDFASKYPDRVGSEPKIGAICVWEACPEFSQYGHVGKVTRIFSDGSFITWEANRVAGKITCQKITSREHITGFIYPKGVNMSASPEQVPNTENNIVETPAKPFYVIEDNCYPASFAEVSPSGKVWIVFSNIVAKDVTEYNFNKYVKFTTKLRSTTCFERKDENGRTTFIFSSKFWVPGDRIEIKIKSDLKDINSQTLNKDYAMCFKLCEQKLVSTGPGNQNYSIKNYGLIKHWTTTFFKQVPSIRDCAFDENDNLWLISSSVFAKITNNYNESVVFSATGDIQLLTMGALCIDGQSIYFLAKTRSQETVIDAILEYNILTGTLVYKACGLNYRGFRRPRLLTKNKIAVVYDKIDPCLARLRIINFGNNTYVHQADSNNCQYLQKVNQDAPVSMDPQGNIYLIIDGENHSEIASFDSNFNFKGNVMLPNLKKDESIYSMDIDKKGDFYLLIRRQSIWYFEKYKLKSNMLKLIFSCQTATNAEFIRVRNGDFVAIGSTYELLIYKGIR